MWTIILYEQRGDVLKDKGLFLVVQLDYQLQAGLTESISWFCRVMTLSFFSLVTPHPQDITLLMASPLKRKGNTFPSGILNQNIIATTAKTFSYI